MNKILYLALLIILCSCCSVISAQSNKTFFLGHSLINFHVPNMVNKLSIAGTQNFDYDVNIGIGAPLIWQWNNPTTGQGDQWDLTLPQGGYEHFIVTEAVPLVGHLEYSNTYRIADSLYLFAQQYNPNIQYYIYETWHCTNSGDGSTSGEGGYPCSWDPDSNTSWRDRLDYDLPKWESIADSINLIHANPMLVIPNGQAFARLYDSIQIGSVPGLSSAFDLFTDDYHLDSRGNYFIACVVYSVIHGVSPVGLPNQLTTEYDVPYDIYPTPAQALKLQEIAWKTVCDYQRSGVECETVGIASDINESHRVNIYPVPVYQILNIESNLFKEATQFAIVDQFGKIRINGIIDSETISVDVSGISEGLYFLITKNQAIKFIK